MNLIQSLHQYISNTIDGCPESEILERANAVCSRQKFMEGEGKRIETTTNCECGSRRTCRGRQLVTVHHKQLNPRALDTLGCNGFEDAVMVTATSASHTQHTTTNLLCPSRYCCCGVLCVCVKHWVCDRRDGQSEFAENTVGRIVDLLT